MKRAMTLLMLLTLVLPAIAAEAAYVRLTVPFFCLSEIPEDIDLVEAELNEITRRKIGAEIDLVPLLALAGSNPDTRREAELKLLELEGTSFDLVMDELPDFSERTIALDALLEAYGQDIIAAVGEARLQDYRVNGTLYTLPSASDYVGSQGISMRRDILEKYDIDISSVQCAQDLMPIFEIVHENEPELGVVCGYYTHSAVQSFQINAELVRGTVFSLADADPDTLACYYATEAFREHVKLVHEWYEAGYIYSGMSLQNTEALSLVATGELFSCITAYKPGIEQEVSNNCGMEMVSIPLMDPVVSNHSNSMRHWGISESCAHPEKAMQFLNLMYSDSDVVNLLAYGIENVHYSFREDGTIGYPENVNHLSVGYANSMPWLLPNQLISYVWEGYDADLWEQLDAYNQSAERSPLVGFTFDDAAVFSEHAKIKEIKKKYFYGLAGGKLDPDIYLPQMLAEMEAAGLERVLAEVQRQYDEWRTAREEQS